MLHQLVNSLKIELSKKLPGLESQLRMAPDIRINELRYLNPGPKSKKGSVLILLYQNTEGEICFPLIERTAYDGVHSGQISLPGGKMEPGESYYETALRETHEEIGIDAERVEIIGELTNFYIWVSNFSVRPIVGFMDEMPQFKPDYHEVEKVIEVKMQDFLRSGAIKKKKIKTALGYTIDSPYYDVADQVIWGATAMMLSEFFSIIKNIKEK